MEIGLSAFHNFAALTCGLALLAGCGSPCVLQQLSDDQVRANEASTVREAAARAAVAKVGATVCRRFTAGISEQDWVRAPVIAAERDRIRVRILSPGRFPHEHHGTLLAAGLLFWDSPLQWTPCK